MVKLFPDMLAELNADLNSWNKLKKDSAFTILLSYAFDAEKKMSLPAGIPPFKPDGAPPFLSPSTLRYECKRLYVFTRGDITDKRRELLFVQMMESVHPSEAEVLCLVKDQKLHEKYPNITHMWAASVGLRCPVTKEEQFRPLSESSKESVVETESSEEQVEQVSVHTESEVVKDESVKETKKRSKKG